MDETLTVQIWSLSTWPSSRRFLPRGMCRWTQCGRPGVPEGSVVILFIDIADSTALTERLGDAAFRERARTVDERVRALIREHGGTPVEGKVLGDGVMAVFTSRAASLDERVTRDASN
jgi:class 3 adenylate cyclase